MTSRRIAGIAIAAAALVSAGLAPARADAGAISKSDNISLIKQFPYTGGSELDASGRYVYSGEINGDTDRNQDPEKGGLHIYDVGGKTPKEVGFLHCPGNDNDVAVVKPGLVVMGFHQNVCASPPGHGLITVDVRNPKRPKILGSITIPGASSHTLTPYPGTNYVYVNPGGLANGASNEHIVDVSNPKKPELVATFKSHPMGCHDLSFYISKDKKLGFCAGYGGVEIWDASDPLAPTVISRIVNPVIQFVHFAIASSDGNLLAIDDEAFALHECRTGQSPTGSVWIYDVSNPATPLVQSRYAPPRGGGPGVGTYAGWVPSWCLSHGLDWQPGTHNLAVTWFTGGVSVLDLSTPTTPSEIAHFQGENAMTYSALWHNGKLFTNDYGRGLDVFRIKLPKS